MKLALNQNLGMTILAGAVLLSLSACGGGGGSSNGGAAVTPSGTQSGGGSTDGSAILLVQSVKLAAGTGYSLAVTASGQVQAWGSGMNGMPPTVSNVSAVGVTTWGTGLDASWAITGNGDLLYWGHDAKGNLISQARTLSGLGHVAAAGACGTGNGALLYVLKTDGTVWAVPARDLSSTTQGFAVTGMGQAVIALGGDDGDTSCGTMLAIGHDRTVRQLVASNPADAGGVPTQASAQQSAALASLSNVKQVSCAASSCLAVDTDGGVMAWGLNDHGQLGDGTHDDALTPITLTGEGNTLPSSGGVLMTAGAAAYAITKDGALYGWGKLDGPFTSPNGNAPGTLPSLLVSNAWSVQALSVSSTVPGHTLFEVGSGTVFGWGSNSQGEVKSGAAASLVVSTDTGVSLLP